MTEADGVRPRAPGDKKMMGAFAAFFSARECEDEGSVFVSQSGQIRASLDSTSTPCASRSFSEAGAPATRALALEAFPPVLPLARLPLIRFHDISR